MPKDPTTIDVLGQQLQRNFGDISQLLGSVLTGLSGEIEAQVKQEIVKVFGDTDFDAIIRQQVELVIEKNLEAYNQRLHAGFNNALKSIVESVENDLDEKVRVAAKNAINTIDIPNLVQKTVRSIYEDKIKSYDFPDLSINASAIQWKDFNLSGNIIKGGIINDFGSQGIKDNANQVQLTIADDAVSVSNKLISNEVHSGHAELGNLTVRGKLSVTGDFEITESLSEMLAKVGTIAINEYFDNDLDIKNKNILSNEKLLLNSTTLGPSVVNSNIRKLGLLQNLRVQGDSEFGGTMTVSENKRVGINTDSPEGALTIWDEDAEITISKNSRRTMRIGSTRDGELVLGAANKNQLYIKNNLVEITDPLKIMGIKFSVLDHIPDHNGEPGEIVYNRAARSGQPLIYICQGNNSWAAVNIST